MAIDRTVIGNSYEGRAIVLHKKIGKNSNPVLLIGGVHGDEPEGYYLVKRYIMESSDLEFCLYAIPQLNPDGCYCSKRQNSRGVDLNRNLPTRDWTSIVSSKRYYPGDEPASEIETKILIDVIQRIIPICIISLHSWNPLINYNGPSEDIAIEMSKYNEYRVTKSVGYPTPGALGTWAGWERGIPTITLEIEAGLDFERVWDKHNRALTEGFKFAVKRTSI